ncbi:tetratricopeptide repeat protein [Marinobacteraceae bacterium S3BR75-40.1]
MVDSYRTEEEQIAAIKDWWKRNGNAILIGVGLALLIIFGWQYWQKRQANEAAAAANSFQELVQVMNNQDAEKRDASVAYIADQLRKEHGSSPYAIFASLLQAKTLVEEGKPGDAIPQLEWALEHAGASPMPLVVREQLARAQFANGDSEAALATLSAANDAGAYTALYKELEGDVLKAQGDLDGARAAYKAAQEAGNSDTPNRILELKMADLATAEAS